MGPHLLPVVSAATEYSSESRPCCTVSSGHHTHPYFRDKKFEAPESSGRGELTRLILRTQVLSDSVLKWSQQFLHHIWDHRGRTPCCMRPLANVESPRIQACCWKRTSQHVQPGGLALSCAALWLHCPWAS